MLFGTFLSVFSKRLKICKKKGHMLHLEFDKLQKEGLVDRLIWRFHFQIPRYRSCDLPPPKKKLGNFWKRYRWKKWLFFYPQNDPKVSDFYHNLHDCYKYLHKSSWLNVNDKQCLCNVFFMCVGISWIHRNFFFTSIAYWCKHFRIGMLSGQQL